MIFKILYKLLKLYLCNNFIEGIYSENNKWNVHDIVLKLALEC